MINNDYIRYFYKRKGETKMQKESIFQKNSNAIYFIDSKNKNRKIVLNRKDFDYLVVKLVDNSYALLSKSDFEEDFFLGDFKSEEFKYYIFEDEENIPVVYFENTSTKEQASSICLNLSELEEVLETETAGV